MKGQNQKWRFIFSQCFCWVLLLQLLNISIDTPACTDSLSAASQKQLKKEYNQIESICELIAEEIADTALPDDEGPELAKTIQPVVLYCSPTPAPLGLFNPPPLQHQDYYSAQYPLLFGEPPFQPPKYA